jgi:hypothetical protein
MTICEHPIFADYFEIVAGVVTIGALIAVIYQIFNEKKERKEDVSSLSDQTQALQTIASAGQQQAQELIAINSNLEIQNTKQIAELKIISERLGDIVKQSSDEADRQKRADYFANEQRRIDIMPHFFPKMWGINEQSINLAIENRGDTALDVKVSKTENCEIRPFDSVRKEKNSRVELKGRPTSVTSIQGIRMPGKTHILLELQFEDVDHNRYRQTFDFPNGMEQAPFFSDPDLLK